MESLDWPSVVGALGRGARTALGRRAVAELAWLECPEDVHQAHEEIADLVRLAEDEIEVPLDGLHNVSPLLGRAALGDVLDDAELRQCATTLAALAVLARSLGDHATEAPTLSAHGSAIRVDERLHDEFVAAYEGERLSSRAYPALRELRDRIASLHREIQSTLESMLHGEEWKDLLQDEFVTLRDERYVLPIKAHAKRWDLGIVHGTSASGQTVYVEPKEVVGLNNKLRLAEGDLAAEELRIRTALSRHLGVHRADLDLSLEAASRVDLAVARYALAVHLGCTRPAVAEDGAIHLQGVRHPVLALRGVPVVANDLHLDAGKPALILTGPNAGGKTVALKTIGLCALLVRAGCWVPAEAGSRVDLFSQICVDIGDQQTVLQDLSSFSAHLQMLARMLDAAGAGVLCLLDEIATGTDPSQGSALATAVLEELVARGARVVVTTHYAQLKALAVQDSRFAVAGMEYRDHAPTYRVIAGATGSSHAFAVASRMGVPDAVVARARERMGAAERSLQDALAALEARKEDAAREADAAAAVRREMETAMASLREREARVRARAIALEEEVASAYKRRISEARDAIGKVVADLQRQPSQARARAARQTLDALEALAPAAPEPTANHEPPSVAAGDRVRIASLGDQLADVVEVREGQVTVRVGGITTRVAPDEVRLVSHPSAPEPPRAETRRQAPKKDRPRVHLASVLRTPANTLDLRGLRIEEAEAAIGAFLDKATMSSWDAVFILHGHGSGAIKEAVRTEWLRSSPYVREYAAANADQGGDAFTVVALA